MFSGFLKKTERKSDRENTGKRPAKYTKIMIAEIVVHDCVSSALIRTEPPAADPM